MLLSWVPPATPMTREKFDEAVVDAEHGGPQRAADAGTVATLERAMRPPAGMPCIAAIVRPAAASCCAIEAVASASSR